jgi:hypothetical protein
MSRIAAEALNNEKYELLRKKLGNTGNVDGLKKVASSLFQRVPEIMGDLEEQLEEVAKRQQKAALLELVMDKIKELVEGDKDYTLELNMPVKLSAYISFADLLVTVVRSSNRQWVVHLLRDYPPARREAAADMTEQGYELRHKLRHKLKDAKLLSDVQIEVREDRMWLRLAVVRLTKNKKISKKKLEGSRPVFMVYFPGEPYFYAGPGLREEVGQAMADSLNCGGWEALPLEGHHVESLRRMRLGRDARDGPVRARPGPERFQLGGEGGAGSQPAAQQPVIERGRWALEGEFRGRSELRRPEAMVADQRLGQTLVVAGKDIVSGLLALAQLGVFESPTPRWVTNFSTAGRTQVPRWRPIPQLTITFQFTLDASAGRAVADREAEAEDWDRYSHISTRSRTAAAGLDLPRL